MLVTGAEPRPQPLDIFQKKLARKKTKNKRLVHVHVLCWNISSKIAFYATLGYQSWFTKTAVKLYLAFLFLKYFSMQNFHKKKKTRKTTLN